MNFGLILFKISSQKGKHDIVVGPAKFIKFKDFKNPYIKDCYCKIYCKRNYNPNFQDIF